MASGGSTLDENVPPDKHNHQALLDASFGLDIPSQANVETKLKKKCRIFYSGASLERGAVPFSFRGGRPGQE